MGISAWQLLIIALIVVLLFGTNKLRTLGSDLGSAIKGFKKAVSDDSTTTQTTNPQQSTQQDADFKPNSLSEQATDIHADTSKKANKEQV